MWIEAFRDGLTNQDLLLSNGSLGAEKDIDVFLCPGVFVPGNNLTELLQSPLGNVLAGLHLS
jgi:hypothetical protein